MIFFHPTDLTLSLFSTDDLAPEARRRVASHVGRCEKCFAYVAAMRSTAAIAAALPAPGASEDGLALIRARRAASERVLLPSATADVPGDSHRVAWPIAAAGVLVIAMAFFSSARDLPAVATESELSLSPSAPRAGDRVRVIYRPIPSLFPRDPRLVLRARARTASAEEFEPHGVMLIDLDTLVRDRSGVFRGTFALPDSVVFAALVVENTAATVVDDREGRVWELMVHGTDDRPTFEALEQREHDQMGRSWEEAYATARQKAELYPDLIRSWSSLEFFERQVLGDSVADSAATARQPQVQAVLAAYRADLSVPADELATALFRAYAQADTTAWNYWSDRIQREAPHHPRTAENAALRAAGKYARNSAHNRLLVDFEEIWERHGPVVDRPGHFLLQAALRAAAQGQDVAAYRRWAYRTMATRPAIVSYYARHFLRYPELRDEGLAILRGQLTRSSFESGHPRALGDTRADYARLFAADRRYVLAAIGGGLIDAGNSRGGLDTLTLAVRDGWDLALLRQVATARMVAGDTVGALAIEAKIAVDPRTSATQRDSIMTLGKRVVGAASWTRSVADAREFMIESVMQQSVVHLVTGDPHLTDGMGRTVELRGLIANKPGLVVYWSRFCGPALEALARIDSVATVLRRNGAAAFLVVDEPPSAELTAFLKERNVTTPVYHDTKRELANGFRNFATPAFYVLDPAGRIRFTRARTESELLLQIAAVRAEHHKLP